MLRRLLGAQVELAVRGDQLPRVDADTGQLEQVLMNLAVNARDALPDGGHLTIETSACELGDEAAAARGLPAGSYVLLEVTDDGTGMDEAVRRHVFEPFFTTKDEARGTGLGLSIVHGIVTQARGAVSVYSEPGHGTTFRIHLPVATGEAAAPPPAEVPAPDRLPPVTVLIVDDDHQVRGVAERILEAAGCTVIAAASVAEAERACVAHEGDIHVLLSDVVLGDGRGDVLARRLVELRPQLRVILTSGFPASTLAEDGDRPRHLVPKPFVPSELRAAVAGVLAGAETPSERIPTEVRAQPRVLVVDDDALVRRGLARVLGAAGFAVVEAGGGREAVQLAEATPFDVVVSDIQMPGGGGLDLLRDVRRVDLDVPVILITGQPDVRSAAQAIEHGAFRYLTKPIDFSALDKAVRHASRAHALARIRRDAFRASGGHGRAAADRAGLEVRLDSALDGLWLAFQPIFRAESGALYGYEALMRSDEPSMPGPQDVLDAATELGRIHHVGRRVRALAAAAFTALGEDVDLFVNLHPDDLADAELIMDQAPLVDVAPRVILEVTERASLRASEALTRRLARLRELGFRLAIDDIGAGYSGLSTFADLIPEVVKIDMSLVRDVHLSAVKQRTIQSLCTLSHEVGSLVVGEGVETPSERDCLVGLGCDLLQGYLLGRPTREP